MDDYAKDGGPGRLTFMCRVSQKKTPDVSFDVKLTTTVFARSAFIFSESSYFYLKFDIKQSKIG